MIELDNLTHLAPGATENCRNADSLHERAVDGLGDLPSTHAGINALTAPFQKIMRLASRLLQSPAAVIKLTHGNEVWYQACFGFSAHVGTFESAPEFPSFFATLPFVPDMRTPDMYRLDEPALVGEISIRFYVSVPLIRGNGYQFGTLYILGPERRQLGEFETGALMDIAAIAVDEIEAYLSGLPVWQEEELSSRILSERDIIRLDAPQRRAAHSSGRQECEDRYLSLIGLLSDWHWEQDETGRFTLIAETGHTSTPARFQHYIGKTFREIPEMRMTEKHWRNLDEAIARHQSFQEVIFQWKEAESAAYYLSMSGQPMFSADGEFKGYRGITKDVTEKIRFQEELARSNAALRELSEAQQAFREAERKRIAHELHDELAQLLASSRMELCLLQRDLKSASPNHERLAIVDRMIGSSIHSLRKLATDLRPSSLDEGGLYYALRSLLKTFSENTGIECLLLANESELTMDAWLSTTIFRLVEECLTNSGRHASAKKAVVQIYRNANTVEIRVQDDGRGIHQDEIHKEKAFGLMEMRERVRRMNGQIDIKGLPGKGTHIAISLPHYCQA